MVNAYTDILSGASLGVSLVQTAYDRAVEFALRAQPMFRAVADKRPVQQAMPGSSVVFQLYADLPTATTALTENVDPDSVAVPSTSSVTVTLAEYGNATLTTRKLRLFSLSDVDPAIADIVAFNMADSLDSIFLTELRGGTNVVREIAGTLTVGGATVSVTATDKLASKHVRYAVARLRSNKVVPRKGTLYWCSLHPEVSHDLRAESGAGGWRVPHEYQSGTEIWAGEIGTYEGAFFIESPRNYSATDGASSAKVHRTLFAGQQALAEAIAEEPHTVIGPVVDKLMRFRPLGWYGVLGTKRYREAALYRVETSTTIPT